MGEYLIVLTKEAKKDLEKLKKSGRKKDLEKIDAFFKEIKINPRFGTGDVEQLRYVKGEIWSRRINKKDRFVYRIYENDNTIAILSSLGHYKLIK